MKVKITLYKPDGVSGLQTEEVVEECFNFTTLDGCLKLIQSQYPGYRQDYTTASKIYSGLAWKCVEVLNDQNETT